MNITKRMNKMAVWRDYRDFDGCVTSRSRDVSRYAKFRRECGHPQWTYAQDRAAREWEAEFDRDLKAKNLDDGLTERCRRGVGWVKRRTPDRSLRCKHPHIPLADLFPPAWKLRARARAKEAA